MAVLDRIATARDDAFAARVAMILMTSCVNVANEDPTYENHANRLHFAQLHFRAAVNTKALAAAIIANNTTIQGEIDSAPTQLGANVPDSDLEYVIGGLFDNFANAYASVS
ncbi:hypothetical protein [Paraburkholderia sp. MM6662-R1]|uniref:hypothetical protein n=1 Tax=Paraburkholderia sp. MM6662-R1 TaxID=2991066 RepID=UPI003D1DCF67